MRRDTFKSAIDRGFINIKSHAQEPMRAVDIDEPRRDTHIVDMLPALPPEERDFYGSEGHVVDWSGKSRAMFEAMEQFSFVEGSYDEYISYAQRERERPPKRHVVLHRHLGRQGSSRLRRCAEE